MSRGGNIRWIGCECAFAEPEQLGNRKSKRVVQNKKNGHKNPNDSYNYHDEIEHHQVISHKSYAT